MSEITLQADIDATLTLDGIGAIGGFQVITGGEESAEVTDDFPPGGEYADKSVGKATISNIILRRTWKEDRDRPLYAKTKGNLGATGTVGRLVRDKARNVSGQDTFTVKLMRNKGVEGDTNAGNAKAEWEMEFAVTGTG